jgi:hypothetical protein
MACSIDREFLSTALSGDSLVLDSINSIWRQSVVLLVDGM